MQQIIELDEHDDVHSIRDRIATAQSPRVILVVPWDSPVLRKLVDLQVVQRFAETNKIEVAIVSTESDIRTAAREAGLPTFRSVDVAQHKVHWHKLIDEEDELVPWQPSPRKKREARRAAVERDQADALARRRHPAWRVIKYGLVVIVLIVLIAAAFAIIPHAEIVFVPRSTQIIASINVVADPVAQFHGRSQPGDVGRAGDLCHHRP